MNIKVDFDNIVVKEDKNDFNVKVLMLKGEKGDQGDGEPNVIEKVQVNGTDLPVINKTVNVLVPTVDSAISSSSTNPVQNKVIYNALSDKVDTSALNNYYEVSEVDSLLGNKADASIVDKKPYYFDNVANMKAYNLEVGDYAITKGYYSANDGGGANYEITNIESQTEYQEELNNELYATLIIDNSINVKQIGAYGDGEHDDTSSITIAINNCDTIFIPDGTYKVGLSFNALKHKEIYGGGNTKLISNESNYIFSLTGDTYDIEHLNEYIKIHDLILDGQNLYSGMYLNLLQTFDMQNIRIENVKKGIYFQDTMDGKCYNLSIFKGVSEASTGDYALEFNHNLDTCNSISFFGCHVELFACMVKIESARSICFYGSKFERHADNDTSNNPIKLNDNVRECVFDGCFFVGANGVGSQSYIINDTKPFISTTLTQTKYSSVYFDKCSFITSSPNETYVYWFNGLNTNFTNCNFQSARRTVSTNYPLTLNGTCKFRNIRIDCNNGYRAFAIAGNDNVLENIEIITSETNITDRSFYIAPNLNRLLLTWCYRGTQPPSQLYPSSDPSRLVKCENIYDIGGE